MSYFLYYRSSGLWVTNSIADFFFAPYSPKHAIFRFGYQSPAAGMEWYTDLLGIEASRRLLSALTDSFMKLGDGEELMQLASKTLVLVCRNGTFSRLLLFGPEFARDTMRVDAWPEMVDAPAHFRAYYQHYQLGSGGEWHVWLRRSENIPAYALRVMQRIGDFSNSTLHIQVARASAPFPPGLGSGVKAVGGP